MRLGDVTVLDLTRLLPGPYATQVLADMGADVVKVERPGIGDYARAMAAGDGPDVFGAVNRGKRSVTIDLQADAGQGAFLELAADADVVVEGFRPGVADRLGVGYEPVSAANPEVVYCSLSGFGATGPNRDRAGHDLNYVGMAGLLDLTRAEADGRPAIPGFPVADVAGGLYAALAVVSALLARELGDGGGEHLDVALTDAVVGLSQAVASDALAGGDPRARETPLTGQFPCYDVYETADGRWVTLAALEPEFWGTFCEAVDRPDLADRHLSTDPAVRDALRGEVAAVFAERTREEWEGLLGDVDAMVAPVRTMREALASDQVTARDLVGDGPAGERVGLPVRSSAGTGDTDEAVPDLGEHTEAVLSDHGLDVAALRDADAL
jgi:crotonobetainyl-CoA:carnitine CoA-transferase CaiB-like acyl-CoA transferase